MDNRKRLRLETVANTSSENENELSATKCDEQSIFLTANNMNASEPLTGDVYFTICDDNSNDSQEYYAIAEGELEHIKQERDMTLQTLPLPCRILNDTSRQLDNNSTAVSIRSAHTGIPAAVELPSGCEIYLVKEYVEHNTSHDKSNIMQEDENNKVKNLSININNAIKAAINNNADNNLARTVTNSIATAGTVANDTTDIETKRKNIILETYKKRDDRRRATHNEVERRRRDKINSWIFKLKEMLPAEMSSNNVTFKSATTSKNSSDTHNDNDCLASKMMICKEHLQMEKRRNCNSNNITSNRSQQNDSKSQILIKACEYIKAMQQEIKSLRECLTENEQLRISNQILQSELNKIKNESGDRTTNHNHNINNNSSSSNSNTIFNSLFGSAATSANIKSVPAATLLVGSSNSNSSSNMSTTSPYSKRELIIRDYVD